ncbi:hypothetical protein [Nocardiopsis eucommiae]|uniref:hypothetical protein n=1 Tax=Nocardiopsis eucommiae TaxID=2831970 RepID=UPI003D75FB76
MSEDSREEGVILHLFESTTGETNGTVIAQIFDEALDRLVTQWAYNQIDNRQWPSGFVRKVADLVRSERNRQGFMSYVGKCEMFASRSMQDGFQRSCYYRSHIQILIDDFVPFADLVHPADVGALADIDEIYVDDANQIPPIPPEDIPSWVPESHWWWRAPTRLDMSQQEIDEKLNDYHPEDWETP